MLEIKNISYKADNKKSIIKDVSFLCKKIMKKLVITGPNGSGKSTLLKNNYGNNTTNCRKYNL